MTLWDKIILIVEVSKLIKGHTRELRSSGLLRRG